MYSNIYVNIDVCMLNNTHVLAYSFYGSGILAQFSEVLCFQLSHKIVIKVLARTGVLSDGLIGKEFASKLMGLFSRISVTQELLDRRPQFLAG